MFVFVEEKERIRKKSDRVRTMFALKTIFMCLFNLCALSDILRDFLSYSIVIFGP